MRDWLIHIKRGEYASLQTQIREALVSAILDRQLDQQESVPSMGKSLDEKKIEPSIKLLADLIRSLR